MDGDGAVANEGSTGEEREEGVGIVVGVGASVEGTAKVVLAGEITNFAGFGLEGVAFAVLATLGWKC